MYIMKSNITLSLETDIKEKLQNTPNQSFLVEKLLRQHFQIEKNTQTLRDPVAEIQQRAEEYKLKMAQDKKEHDVLIDAILQKEKVKKLIASRKYPDEIIRWLTSQRELPDNDTAIVNVWQNLAGRFPLEKVQVSDIREVHALIHTLQTNEEQNDEKRDLDTDE